jgi:phospholipid/cholesterol/gamma-HCH transport system substrate-binding protein
LENRAHALIAGIFAFVLAAAAIAAAVWLSGDSVRYKPYVLVARSPVSGLNPEAQVRLRGVAVGKVTSIRFDPDNPMQILVRILVDEATPLTAGTYATLGYQGITGLAYINLDDSGKDAAPLKSSPDAVARIDLQPSFFDQLTQSGQELLINAGETAKRLNAVLDDQNRGRIADALADLEVLSKRMIGVAERLDPVIAALPQIERKADAALGRAEAALSDLQRLSQEARAQLGSIERASSALQRGAASWGALADHIDSETVPAVNGAAGRFSRATGSVGRLAGELQSQPQGLLFGPPLPEPGPGEPGFQPPRAAQP